MYISDLTKIRRRKEAFFHNKNIKVEECFYGAEFDAKVIRKAVAEEIITWEELETTDEKISQTVIEVQVREAIRFFGYLATCDGLQHAESLVKSIRKAVADKVIDWDQLKTTDEGLDKLLIKIQAREAKSFVKRMREEYPFSICQFTDGWIRSIRKAVAENVISWKELDTTEEYFNKLAFAYSDNPMRLFGNKFDPSYNL